MVDPAHFVNLNYILLLNKYLISVTELKCTMLLKSLFRNHKKNLYRKKQSKFKEEESIKYRQKKLGRIHFEIGKYKQHTKIRVNY